MKLPNVSTAHGAPMGRSDCITEPDARVKLHLQRVHLDAGGYDNGGAYWGHGEPLYFAWGDGQRERQEMFLRAPDRPAAKALILETFPHARFYGGSDTAPRGVWWTTGSGRIALRMSRAQAAGASHSGQCDADVAELIKAPSIERQLSKIEPALLVRELKEWGAWDDKELSDHAANLQRLVWLAAGDIRDGNA